MSLVESNGDPSPRERKALALSLCALAGVAALIILVDPDGLRFIAWVSGLAWCASMLFNEDEPRTRQGKGIIVPLVAGALYAAARYFEAPAAIATAAATAFVVLGVYVWSCDSFGRRFYRTWTQLFRPLAWSVSTLLLVLVYYNVLTPIGLKLRLFGRDPMHRKFDRNATTYWVKRDEPVDPERYFRQF